MDRSDGSRLGAPRRSVLKLLSAAAAAGTLPVAGADQDAQPEYVVVQGDRCVPVTPLSGEEPVEELYDWREEETHYSSAGTVDLQRDDTSILFLYEGPDGTTLVLVHGHYRSSDSDGGSVSMTFEGLPTDGEWVVEDDRYDAESNVDTWDHDGSRSEIDWTYRYGRTDGGAFLGLEGDFEVRIDPAFNDESAYRNQHYEGTITDWEVLSGDIESPERTSLSLDEPVVIRPGDCTDRDPDEGDAEPSEDGSTEDGSDGGGSEDGTEEGDQEENGTESDPKEDGTAEEDSGDGEEDSGDGEGDDGSDARGDESEREGGESDGEDRGKTKHEKKQRKHREKHEKKQRKHREKHEKKQRKHQKKHELRQEKHQKKHELKQRKHQKKHELKRRKHRKKHEKQRRKHERGD